MDYTNFRSAIGGFRRSDVFSYIERTSQEHRQKLRELEKENAALTAENDALKTLLAELPVHNEQVSETPEAESLDAQELSAYRRAEAAERSARRRAARLMDQLHSLTEKADNSLSTVQDEAQTLISILNEQTKALQALSGQALTILQTLRSDIQDLDTQAEYTDNETDE